MKQERKTSFSQQEFSRKDAKVAKTQSPVRFALCVFATFASLRETVCLRYGRAGKSGLILAVLIAICAVAAWTGTSRAAGSQDVFIKAGWFHVLWGDGPAGADAQTTLKYFLVDDQGEWIELKLDSKFGEVPGSPLAFNRKRVQVVGEQPDTSAGPILVRNVTVEEPLAGEAPATEALTGTKRWVTILCRFADSTSITPAPASYFSGLMAGTNPGMDHYWREVSYGNINLTGSQVLGWYNLPHPRSYYVYDRNNDGSLDFDFERSVADATAVADPDVFFPDFYGINFIFNQELDGASWGGGASVSKDGVVNRVFGATYMPPSAFADQSRLAHEMGHGFGLPHSSGPYSATYDSQWDLMSAGGTCSLRNTNYGCVGVHTISYHKDKLGWIAAGRKYLAPGASNATISIERLGQPVSGNNYLMAQIPIGGEANRFYTVEARFFAGYDSQIPGEAIVIHEVDIARGDRVARVVDADNNGDPNDAGARWTPGETFSDAARGIQVTVNSMNATSFNVTISVTQAPQTYTIDGRVTDGGTGLNGATMTLTSSGLQIATTTSDANGNYLFAGVAAGATYSLTPSKPAYAFNPQQLTFTNLSGNATANFSGTLQSYPIGGRVTRADGAGVGGVQVNLSGSASVHTTTDVDGNYSFGSFPGGGNYVLTPSRDGYTFNPANASAPLLTANWTANFTGTPLDTGGTIQFGQVSYSVSEGTEVASINVTRNGGTAGAATVDYATSDGTATQRTDYTMASGTLSFSTGETSKNANVMIADNAYVDGNRTINLTLSNPTGGVMANPNVAVLTITDNDTSAPASNPIDEAQFFVRQHYHDFLNRVPDPGGLAYWSQQITQCGTDANCINARRIGVSAAYFVELEFQNTGSYVYCLYKASYGQRPTYAQFMPDRSHLIDGLNLDLSKLAFAEVWVKRPEFIAKYPLDLSGTKFIDLLLQTAQNSSGVDLSELRATLINDFITYGSRARIAYLVAENQTFRLAEYNKAFVLMEYFGYLRRDPDENGYQFWLDILNNRVPNNYRSMVCAFLNSAEYQERFSSVRTRTDNLCSQAQ